MGRRSRRPPPRVYHDGLIPTATDTYHTYPEVVPDDHDPVKHEKSYPELVPPSLDSEPQPQQHPSHHPPHLQQHPQQQQPPSTIPTPPSAHHAAHHHQQHQHQQLQQQYHPAPVPNPVNPQPLALPRTSGVHSLRQAWSEIDGFDHARRNKRWHRRGRGKGRARGMFGLGGGGPEGGGGVGAGAGAAGGFDGHRHGDGDANGVDRDDEDDDGDSFSFGAEKPPVWKRPIFWVIIIAGAVIVALAGILGGVASGGIKTAWDGDRVRSGTLPSVADPACPGHSNRNYTSPVTTPQKKFRIQCGANYSGGDGTLGLQNDTAVESIAACIDACAQHAECVGAVYRPGDAAECWLKQFIGVVSTGEDAGGMVSGVLWQ